MSAKSVFGAAGAGLACAAGAGGLLHLLGIDSAASQAATAAVCAAMSTSLWLWWRKLAPLLRGLGDIAELLSGDPQRAQRAGARLQAGIAGNAELRGVLGGVAEHLAELSEAQRDLGSACSDNAIAAAEVSFSVDQLSQRVQQQNAMASDITGSASTATQSVHAVAESAGRAAAAAAQARASSAQGSELLGGALQGMSRISEQSLNASRLIARLDERSEQIQAVTQVIDEIANQTNLLALNAAIEAARAGDQGRGFAVVAEQVRELAARTCEATSEVGRIIGSSHDETAEVVAAVQTLSEDIESGAAQFRAVGEELGTVTGQVAQVEEQISAIAASTEGNVGSISNISASIQRISAELDGSGEYLRDLRQRAEHFTKTAERETARVAEFSQDGPHAQAFAVARDAAAKIGAAFERAIAEGRLSEEQLFDRDYQPIANTDPPKYHTRYDRIADNILPAIQEPLLKANPDLIFAIATDQNGYVPTHNKRFSQPLSGDYAKDLAGNRSKRRFDDPTGSRCGAHTRKLLLQTYKRDTGEIMHDLSVPVYVNGRHWGGFRIGYRPAGCSN